MLRPLIEVPSEFAPTARKFWVADGWIEDGYMAWQYYMLVQENRNVEWDSWLSYGYGVPLVQIWGGGTLSQNIISNGIGPNTDSVLAELGFEIVSGVATPAPEPEFHIVGSVATQSSLPTYGEPLGIYATRDDPSAAYVFWTNARGDSGPTAVTEWAVGTWAEVASMFPGVPVPELD